MENNDKDEKNELEEEGKIKSDSKNSMFSVIVLVIIILFLVVAYLAYKGEWINKVKNIKDYDSSSLNDIMDELAEESSQINEDFDAEAEKQKLEEKKAKFNEGKNNISITKSILKVEDDEKSLILEFTNSNSFDIDTPKINIVFFDAAGEIVGIKQAFTAYLKNNNTYYVKFNKIPQNYETYKLFIDSDTYTQNVQKFDDKVEFNYNYNDEDGVVEINATNNSDERIEELEFAVIFYNQDKTIYDIQIVNFYDLKKNKSDIEKAYEYELDANGNKISYTTDQIEVKLMTAYTIGN